jgi:hypothetical protein
MIVFILLALVAIFFRLFLYSPELMKLVGTLALLFVLTVIGFLLTGPALLAMAVIFRSMK